MKLHDIFLIIFFATLAVSTLVISSPLVTPFKHNEIPYKYSNFGVINYHANSSYKLVFSSESFCSKANKTMFHEPTFLVISPLNIYPCSFTHRASIAEALGAKGIIFALNVPFQSDEEVFPADDGNGRRIHITCLFIESKVWLKLQTLTNIVIKTYFKIPKQEISKVAIHLSSSNRASYTFMRRLQKQYAQFGKAITIEPVYFTFNCSWCPQTYCILDNQYCSFDYDNYQLNAGKDIIIEQIYEYTIYEKLGIKKYLAYMNRFDQQCDYNWLDIVTCRNKILNAMNIPNDLNLSFMLDPEETVALWRKRERALAFDGFPEVTINGMIFRGSFNADQIISAICQSLKHPTKNCEQLQKDKKKTKTTYTLLQKIVISNMIICVILIIGFRLYKRMITRELPNEMTNQVNEIVANYAMVASKKTTQLVEHRHQELHEEL